MDDDASKAFCEEDIDQILERRTQIIRHDNADKGSMFSKASFTATSAGKFKRRKGITIYFFDFGSAIVKSY